MAGETGFKSRISSEAVDNNVTDAYALTGMFANQDDDRAVFTPHYVLAYDFVNVNTRLLANMVRGRVIEVAEQHGYAVKPLTWCDTYGSVLREVAIADSDSHGAVIEIREATDEQLRDTQLYSRLMLGAFMKRECAESAGGEEFVGNVELLVSEVVDKLFEEEGLPDIRTLVRDSNPSYIG